MPDLMKYRLKCPKCGALFYVMLPDLNAFKLNKGRLCKDCMLEYVHTSNRLCKLVPKKSNLKVE